MDYLALLLVLAIAYGVSRLTRGGAWLRCRCGDLICKGCRRHR